MVNKWNFDNIKMLLHGTSVKTVNFCFIEYGTDGHL